MGLRRALEYLDPRGSGRNHLVARPGAAGYRRGVKPDFILGSTSDGRWVDVKLHVSYREKRGVGRGSGGMGAYRVSA